MFEKILIANRGEIAVRIIRACREMGIQTVAVCSEVDKDALHAQLADECVCIGSYKSKDSYLNIEKILSAAIATKADAIHPGFGFLSENSKFAKICNECNIEFIGPSVESMINMGNKSIARQTMIKAGVPVVPGTNEPLTDAYQGWALDGVSKGGHIKNSVNVSSQWMTAGFSSQSAENSTREDYIEQELKAIGVTTAKSYVIYDTNGKDAATVAAYLQKKGYKDLSIYNAKSAINKGTFTMESYKNYDLYVPAEVVKNVSDHVTKNTALSSEAKKVTGGSNIVLTDDDENAEYEETLEWVTDKNAKVNKVKSPKGGSDANGDLFSILPDRNKQAAAGESLYDFDDDDDDDDDFLGAGIKNLSNIDEESPEEIAKKKAEEEARKKAEEEAKKKAEEEAKKKAEEEAKRKAEEEKKRKEAEEARKKAAAEKAKAEAEAKKQQAIDDARKNAEEAKKHAETSKKTIEECEKTEKDLEKQLEEFAAKKQNYDAKMAQEAEAKKKNDAELLEREEKELDANIAKLKKEISDTNESAKKESDRILKESDPDTYKNNMINEAQAAADKAIKALADTKKTNVDKGVAEYNKAVDADKKKLADIDADKKKSIETAKKKRTDEEARAAKIMKTAEADKTKAGAIFSESKKAEEEADANLKNTTEMESQSQKTLDELQKKLEESEKAVKNAKNSRNDANTKLAIQKEELKQADKVEEEAAKAQESARALFSKGVAADMPSVTLAADDFKDGAIDIVSVLVKSGLVTSRNEGRRAVEQGGVAVDGEKIADVQITIPEEKFDGEGVVVRRGKKNFRKVSK